MGNTQTIAWGLLALGLVIFTPRATARGQEGTLAPPSQKAKNALEKLINTPAAIRKKVKGVADAAGRELSNALGEKSSASGPVQSSESKIQGETVTKAIAPVSTRDPFRQPNLKPRARQRQADSNLPPLLRYDIAEFKLVGIAGFKKNTDGMALLLSPEKKSFSVTVGTAIGPKGGRVKTIKASEVVFEESPGGTKSKTLLTWSCQVGRLCSNPHDSLAAESNKSGQ